MQNLISEFEFIYVVNLTFYSIDTHLYVCCRRRRLKTLWQRMKLRLQEQFLSEIAAAGAISSNLKNVHYFQKSEHSRFI